MFGEPSDQLKPSSADNYSKRRRHRRMNPDFADLIESLQPSLERLMASKPFKFSELSKQMVPEAGVYLFSQGAEHLYVGRTNSIRGRLQNHCRPGSNDSQASFAFLLAREKTGFTKATYRPGGSRKHLMQTESFKQVFDEQKALLRTLDIRVAEEANPYRQALLEMYVAVALKTPHNSFDNH